jgi:hypothetical protein
MYAFFKDFAPPIVTLFAALTAGAITCTFARIQTRIAKSQRDIALDRLKFDLFKHRYDIYEAAKLLIEHVSFVSDLDKSEPAKTRLLYIKLDEARFYFPLEIRAALDAIHSACESFFEHLAERDRINIDNRQEWTRVAELLARDQATLRKLYGDLPKIFEPALAFRQLTSSK